jgi:hypothetical protein
MVKELLDQIYRYVNGLCTLQELESWLVFGLQRILDSGETEAIELADRIDADLIEIGEGLIEEIALREFLQSYISSKQTVPIIHIKTRPRGPITVTAIDGTTGIMTGYPDQVQTTRLDRDLVSVV